MENKDLFQILLLVYEAERDGKILNVQTIDKDETVPFKPKIIGQFSFDAKSSYTLKIRAMDNKIFTEEHYKEMMQSLRIDKIGAYKSLIREDFISECEIKYSPDFKDGLPYRSEPQFVDIKKVQVLPNFRDLSVEEIKKNYNTDGKLELLIVKDLKKIYKTLYDGKAFASVDIKPDEVKGIIIRLILNKLASNETTNAIIKHWPIIESNPSWLKIFNRLDLHPESRDIYEKEDENYLKCLGYIGILLDHLDKAEPLPSDLYGKCLVLSERI